MRCFQKKHKKIVFLHTKGINTNQREKVYFIFFLGNPHEEKVSHTDFLLLELLF